MAMFAGCSALSSSKQNPNRKPTDSPKHPPTGRAQKTTTNPASTTPAVPRRLDIGDTVRLGGTVDLTVDTIEIGASLTDATGEEHRASEDSMYLLAEIHAMNVGSVTSVLPPATSFTALADGRGDSNPPERGQHAHGADNRHPIRRAIQSPPRRGATRLPGLRGVTRRDRARHRLEALDV